MGINWNKSISYLLSLPLLLSYSLFRKPPRPPPRSLKGRDPRPLPPVDCLSSPPPPNSLSCSQTENTHTHITNLLYLWTDGNLQNEVKLEWCALLRNTISPCLFPWSRVSVAVGHCCEEVCPSASFLHHCSVSCCPSSLSPHLPHVCHCDHGHDRSPWGLVSVFHQYHQQNWASGLIVQLKKGGEERGGKGSVASWKINFLHDYLDNSSTVKK